MTAFAPIARDTANARLAVATQRRDQGAVNADQVAQLRAVWREIIAWAEAFDAGTRIQPQCGYEPACTETRRAAVAALKAVQADSGNAALRTAAEGASRLAGRLATFSDVWIAVRNPTRGEGFTKAWLDALASLHVPELKNAA